MHLPRLATAALVLTACGTDGTDGTTQTGPDADAAPAAARWNEVEAALTQPLNAVWVSSATQAVAVGRGGLIVEFDGRAWNPVDSPTGEDLVGLWGSGVQRTWAVGAAGTILTREDDAWRVARPGDGPPLRAICGRDTTDVWAVGDGSRAFRNTGDGFQPATVDLPDRLGGLFIDAAGRGTLLGADADGKPVGAAYVTDTGWQAPAPVAGADGLTATDLWGREGDDGAAFATAVDRDGAGVLLRVEAGARRVTRLAATGLGAPTAVLPHEDGVLVATGRTIERFDEATGAFLVETDALDAPVADLQAADGLVVAVGGQDDGRIWVRGGP